MAQVPALGQSRLCSATPSAEKPTLPQDVPSTLVHRSPERSTQDRRTDSDFPSGYLFHALQTTLWTFSLLFKSPPGEGGKKNPEEIRVNWKEKKKKIQKGVHSGEKAQTLPTFKRQQGFQEGAGRPLPTQTWPETRHPSHTAPLSGRRDFNSTTGRPPSWSWANTEPQTRPRRSPAETPRALCGFSEPGSLPGGVGTLGCCGPAGLQAPGLGAWARAVFVNNLGGS
ncbi:uncharacterized protein [Callorhinus ursinus]|uniref:Uncharacterized protein LOC112840607 isoform X3 n=1 Tax=Callorhinus ursinus TaxID=34884 RepID=A0A3Q7QT78_CALUR|nr:uncharacterized protein LOC112840607 isoform X3 [Callorhinus ursinus]